MGRSHQIWIKGAVFFPNDVPIEGYVLYYAEGSGTLKTRTEAHGKVSEVPLNFNGSNHLAMIDDFALEQGYIAYEKMPAAGSVVIVELASSFRVVRHLRMVVI